jgi:multidrug efflux pump
MLAPENERSIMRFNGVPMASNSIVPQPGANHIEIADEVYRRLEQIQRDLPDDVIWGIGFDTTKYIRESILEVQQTIAMAFILVVIIIFLFLRDWRTTVIPVLVIPISLIGTFFVLYLMGYSINVLTLLGIVLAIGLVVDDAIVVLENIYTKIEQGMKPLEAGFKGSQEIFFAVVSTTISLVAVFMPIVFLQGLTGRLFTEFGVTIASAVVISSFVALSLTPMLSSRILKKREKPNFFYRITEPFFVRLTNLYRSSLEAFMQVRWLAIIVVIASLGGTLWLLSIIPQELAPLEDRAGARFFASAPEGSSYEFTDRYVLDFINLVRAETPELQGLVSITSPGFGSSSSVNNVFGRLILIPAEERERSQQEIVDDLNKKIRKLSEARGTFSQEQSIGNRRARYPVQFVIQATSLDKLKDVTPKIEEEARNHPAFSFVDVDLKFTKPEIVLSINRAKANALGVSISAIAQTLQLGISGQRFGFFMMGGKQYQVIGQILEENRNEPLDIRSLYVRNNRGEMIQLDNLITMEERSAPPQLYRYNRYVSATVSTMLNQGYTLGDGINIMREIANKHLDDTYTTALDGPSKDFEESSSSIVFAFILALALVYLTLSAQFESFRDPLIIMFTVPMALFGALYSLWFMDQTNNLFSQIGIIMLIGLVTKNGILIVEFANQKKLQGMDKFTAVKEAAANRFRPILMTSLSTILGILPIALALGAGSESRVSMGVGVVGGMIFSSILTLYIIPSIYSYISSRSKNIASASDYIKQENGTPKKLEEKALAAPTGAI